MKKNFITAKRYSLWLKVIKKWEFIIQKYNKGSIDKSIAVDRLNRIAKITGLRKKVALISLVGLVSFGANAQSLFEEVTLRSEQTFRIPVGTDRSATPFFANLDADSDLELVLGAFNEPLKYYNNVSGFYEEQKGTANPFSTINVGYNSRPVLVNLDSDSDLELVVGEYYGTIKYFDKNTTGVYEEKTGSDNPFDGIDVGSSSSPFFANLDADADLELVVGEFNGNLKYYDKIPSGSYLEQTSNPFSLINVGSFATPTFANLDSDADLELVVGNNSGTIQYYDFTNATGLYEEKTGSNNPFTGIDVQFNSVPTFADHNSDGELELVIGNSTGDLAFFEKNSLGVYEEKKEWSNPFYGIEIPITFVKLEFGSVDSDEEEELIIGGADGTITFYDKNADGFYEEKTGTDNPFNGIDVGRRSDPSFINIDGDADLEVIIGESYGELRYYDKNASGVYELQTGTNNPFSAIDAGFYSSPTVENLDADADLELVVGEYNGGLKYYDKDALGVYTEVTGSDNPFDGINAGFYSSPAFENLDSDADLELAVGNINGAIKYYDRDASGKYVELTGSDNPFLGYDFGSSSSPAFSDLDGDGDLDLIIGIESTFLRELKNNSITVGLNGTDINTSLNLFPNPATSVISTELGELKILDAIGNLVLSQNSNGKVDVSSLESGVYIVTQNGKKTKLIIE